MRPSAPCFAFLILALVPPTTGAAQGVGVEVAPTGADTLAIEALARALSADSMLGRAPGTAGNEASARYLARLLSELGAVPAFGDELLALVEAEVPADGEYPVHNVVGVLPGADGRLDGPAVGITSHFDHLGVGPPDASGDSIYNGFLDAAVPVAVVMDVVRRHARDPGELPLVVMFMNAEEQGLLGARALVVMEGADALLPRLELVVGVDAGSPAGESMEWQLMGTVPDHRGARLADSLALARGWTTTRSPPRPISDVFVFAERGVPILFPIPGAVWRGYSAEERDAAMARFDHYHHPADEWDEAFPWTGTAAFADWLFEIVHLSGRR